MMLRRSLFGRLFGVENIASFMYAMCVMKWEVDDFVEDYVGQQSQLSYDTGA